MPPDDDKRGWFPSNYVVVISDEEAELAFSGFDLDRPETDVADMEFGRLQGRELANAVPSPRIADFWIPEVSSDGRIYYVNTKTGQHAQDIPDEGNVDMDIDIKSALGRGKGRAESSSPSGSRSYPSNGHEAYPPIGDMIVSPDSPSFEEEHLDVSPPVYEEVETNAGSSAQTIVRPTRTTSMGRLAWDMPPPPESPPQSYQQATYSRPTEIITDPEGTVSAGTLPALVERLTTHERADQTFIKSFLMTFKSFTTVDGLFDLLVQRFWIQPPPKTTAAEREEWRRSKQHVIQVRVLNTLRYLVVDDDVLEKADLGILDRMKEFIAMEEVARFPAAKQLWTLIERARQGDSLIKMVAATQGAPPSPLVPRSNKKLQILDIEPLELARQLTIMESRLYQRIRPVDCLQRIWGQQTENTNNITVFIQTSEKIPIWVAESILSEDDSRRRARMIGHFISVADHCRNLKNFSAMARITFGLSTLVGRLTRTWAQVNPRSITQFSACRTAFSDYRSLMNSVIPPCVPFLEVSISSLPDNVPAQSEKESAGDTLDLINFEKRQKAADIVHDIKRWQAPFNLHVIPSIQAHIEHCLNSVSDTADTRERLDAISLELEPRGHEGEMMTRLLQESGFL
ncbi:ras guanine nucleotide exchange factor domain-containing protein [Mycena albidolilacea]|uniref:Ras guanine nucleotide exchange factor domain-containing protein n=1 Tax=Mycena albidolilacea TaxID=1033008 RepID=A0AAD7AS90_9AGAR|nr:ras guanine nucleotide exchange factor domain-containing protein [Mycena albidolilacea]